MSRTLFGAFLILSAVTPLQGQKQPLLEEVSLYAVGATSANPEFPSPIGFGFRSTWTFRHHWLFRLSVDRMEDQSRKMGIVCRNYAPHISCTPTELNNEATLFSIRGGVLRTLVLGSRLRLGFGGGLSFNNLTASSKADSGRTGDLLVPKTGQVGYTASLSADLIVFPSIPVRLTGGLTNHWVHFHTCSGSTPPQYSPFCRISQIREVELGLVLVF